MRDWIENAVGVILGLAFCAFILAVAGSVLYSCGAAVHAWVIDEEPDAYFATVTCDDPVSGDEPIAIKPGMKVEQCLETRRGAYDFVNGYSDFPVTICLGRAGRCDNGHGVAAVTLKPGQKVSFAMPARTTSMGVEVERNYPITIHAPEFAPVDLVVHSLPPRNN